MSDTDPATEPNPTTDTTTEPPVEPPDKGAGTDEDEVAKWKAMARKHEAQAKANAEAAKRLKELEDSQKTEQERLTETLTAAEKRAADAERRLLVRDVADEKGLTRAQAKYLTGATREELEANADQILEDFPQPDRAATGDTRPTPKLRPGAVAAAEPEELDPRKLAAQIPRS